MGFSADQVGIPAFAVGWVPWVTTGGDRDLCGSGHDLVWVRG